MLLSLVLVPFRPMLSPIILLVVAKVVVFAAHILAIIIIVVTDATIFSCRYCHLCLFG
jgi:hypothetical protein